MGLAELSFSDWSAVLAGTFLKRFLLKGYWIRTIVTVLILICTRLRAALSRATSTLYLMFSHLDHALYTLVLCATRKHIVYAHGFHFWVLTDVIMALYLIIWVDPPAWR